MLKNCTPSFHSISPVIPNKWILLVATAQPYEGQVRGKNNNVHTCCYLKYSKVSANKPGHFFFQESNFPCFVFESLIVEYASPFLHSVSLLVDAPAFTLMSFILSSAASLVVLTLFLSGLGLELELLASEVLTLVREKPGQLPAEHDHMHTSVSRSLQSAHAGFCVCVCLCMCMLSMKGCDCSCFCHRPVQVCQRDTDEHTHVHTHTHSVILWGRMAAKEKWLTETEWVTKGQTQWEEVRW